MGCFYSVWLLGHNLTKQPYLGMVSLADLERLYASTKRKRLCGENVLICTRLKTESISHDDSRRPAVTLSLSCQVVSFYLFGFNSRKSTADFGERITRVIERSSVVHL